MRRGAESPLSALLVRVGLLAALGSLAGAAVAGDPVDDLEVWFEDYRKGRAIAIPSSFGSFGKFEQAASTGRASAADLLLRIATFTFGASPVEEGKRWAKVERMHPLATRRAARDALLRMNAPGETLQKYFMLVMYDEERPAPERSLATLALRRQITSFDGPAAVFSFAKLAIDAGAPLTVRAEAVNALGDFDFPEALSFLATTLEDRDAELRFLAVRAIGRGFRGMIHTVERDAYGPSGAVDALLELAESGDTIFDARVAAIETLASWPTVESIDRLSRLLAAPLLGNAAFETANLRAAARRTLERMTGKTVRDERPEAWLEWWTDERPRFLLPNIPERDFAGSRYASRFYGTPIRGRKIVFVLDASTSMEGDRIRTLKREMIKVLDTLPDGSRFNVIFFDTGVRRMKQWLVDATPSTIRSAKEFVVRQGASGWTNLFGGLGAAVGIKTPGGERYPRERLPDQIVLLSDGAPSRGVLRAVDDILEEFRRINHDGAIRVDTIAIGADSRLLRELALDNGGEYRNVH